MSKFELLDRKGGVLLLVEAADSTDATLYGFRHVEGFSGNLRDANEVIPEKPDAKMVSSFQALGLSEAGAIDAARGRVYPLRHRPVVHVPRQEATGHGQRQPTAKPAPLEKLSEPALISSFQALGLSEAGAIDAARGRTLGG